MPLRIHQLWLIWTLTYYKETSFIVAARYQNHAGYIGPLGDKVFDTVCPVVDRFNHGDNSVSTCLSHCDMHESCTAAQYNHNEKLCQLMKCPYPIPKPTLTADKGDISYYKDSGYFGPTELIWSEASHCLPFSTFTNTTSWSYCFQKCTEQPRCSAVVYNSLGGRTCTLVLCPIRKIPEPTINVTSYIGFYKKTGYFGPLTKHWSISDCTTLDYDYTTRSVEECKERCDNRPGCTAINLGHSSGSGSCIMKRCPLPVPQPTGNRQHTVGYYKHPGCFSHEFECDSGICILGMYKCDSIDHCDDGSDELYCVCEKHQFECGNLRCISSQKRCDGHDDCGDGSDEQQCACPMTKFECDNTVCIDDFMICNGNDDCGDGSDEKDCSDRPNWCPQDFHWFRNVCFQLHVNANTWKWAESKCRSNDARLMQQKDVDYLITLRDYIYRHVHVSTYEFWMDNEYREPRYSCPYMTKYSILYDYCSTPRRSVCLITSRH